MVMNRSASIFMGGILVGALLATVGFSLILRGQTTGGEQKQLVLKSPPHTGRIRLLAEMFPGAKFIHVVRDPRALFASTVRLWEALDFANGFQIPRERNLEELIFTSFERMYDGFESQRSHLESDAGFICRSDHLIRFSYIFAHGLFQEYMFACLGSGNGYVPVGSWMG